MLKFISFGSGSSGNSYYLFTDKYGILIDSGLGIRTLKKSFREYGLHLNDVNSILVTHDHADHVKSVGCLSTEYNIDVYTTEKVHEGIERNFCVTKKVPSAHKRLIEKDKTFHLGDFEITPFGVPHDSNDNVGYNISAEGINFCLITDVGHITDDIKKFIPKANYLVIEANHDVDMVRSGRYPEYLKTRILGPNGHLSNADCGQVLAENASPALRHVWLCHLSEENNHPELARKTVEQVLRSYGIVVGTDFELTVLKRKVPSDIIELK